MDPKYTREVGTKERFQVVGKDTRLGVERVLRLVVRTPFSARYKWPIEGPRLRNPRTTRIRQKIRGLKRVSAKRKQELHAELLARAMGMTYGRSHPDLDTYKGGPRRVSKKTSKWDKVQQKVRGMVSRFRG